MNLWYWVQPQVESSGSVDLVSLPRLNSLFVPSTEIARKRVPLVDVVLPAEREGLSIVVLLSHAFAACPVMRIAGAA